MNRIKLFTKKYEDSSLFLLIIGLLAALFFCATFLINRVIAVEGGHWYWSGALRFIYTTSFIAVGLIAFKGINYFKKILDEYFKSFIFWNISGTIGFGIFYSLICYAASFSPAWVVATTWQITIVASLIVLHFFNQKLSKKVWFVTFIIFIGVTLVNLSSFDTNNIQALFLGFFPVLIASFAYPIGNQLVWQEKKKRKEKDCKSLEVVNNAFVKVFLLTLGSLPLWILLFFTSETTLYPSKSQLINVSIIAVLSGVIAMSLFLYARSKADTPTKIIAVDSSQSAEVFFALIGEILILNIMLPNFLGVLGVVTTVIGLLILVKLGKD